MTPRPKIAFYAPLKNPYHPVPSGDRLIARLLIKALEMAEFEVSLASRLTSKDMTGDVERQQRFVPLAEKLAERILRKWKQADYKPDLWFTYHLYYKAPDLLGPLIAEHLNIPYVLAEASWSAKRANGSWSCYHQFVGNALWQAAKIFILNPVDRPALEQLLESREKLITLPPFLDSDNMPTVRISRQQLALEWDLDENIPWIATVAMMRRGDKLASYHLLAEAFAGVKQRCNLLIIGSGDARAEVELPLQEIGESDFLESLSMTHFSPLLYESLFHVWPAVNEAFGMNLLEAQWAGLPVIAGDEGGVSSVMKDGETGWLLPARDVKAFTNCMKELLEQPAVSRGRRENCKVYIEKHHSLKSASELLSRQLRELL